MLERWEMESNDLTPIVTAFVQGNVTVIGNALEGTPMVYCLGRELSGNEIESIEILLNAKRN